MSNTKTTPKKGKKATKNKKKIEDFENGGKKGSYYGGVDDATGLPNGEGILTFSE